MRKARILLLLITFNGSWASAIHGEGKCYEINKLEVQGAYQMPRMQLRDLKKQYENKCLNLEEIKGLIKVITNLYVDEGYITTRVSIPEQNLREKKLVILVNEGVLEEIEYARGVGGPRDALPLKKGKILNLRDIEESLEHFTRLKSNNTKIYLKPGNVPGSSIAVLDSQPQKRWHFVGGVDNSGSKNKGRNQAFSHLSLENLLGLNEYYLLGYREALGDHKHNFVRSYNMILSMPYGYNSFTLQYNEARYRTFIRTPRNKYANRGGSRVARFAIDRTVHRDGSSKTNITAGIGRDEYSNYIAENRIETATYRMHKVDIGIRQQRRLNTSSIGFGATYTVGENQNYRTNFGDVVTPGKRFGKLNYNFSWHKPLLATIDKKPLTYNFHLNGQYSGLMLVITEKDTVGGLSSVRGFQDHVENADNSIIARNELEAWVPSFNYGAARLIFGELSVFCAFDIGRFSNYEERGKRTGVMSGVAAGIRNRGGHLSFSVTVAKPVEAPGLTRFPAVVYFSSVINL